MSGDGALAEDDRLRRVYPTGDQGGRHFADVRMKLLRVDFDGERVEVGEEEQAFRLVLHPHPAKDGTEEIAEMQVASRLDAGHDAHRSISRHRYTASGAG